MSLLTGGNIANVERIKVELEGTDAKTYMWETATSCTYTAALSSGTEVEQRVKNAVLGLIRTEDLVKGYDINLADERLNMEIYALVDGGTVTQGEGGADWTKYEAPKAGGSVTRKAFTLTLYTSDRGPDGEANEYYAWTFAHCKGSPVGGGAKDGAFQQLSYEIKSRPAAGVSPLVVTRMESLPEAT